MHRGGPGHSGHAGASASGASSIAESSHALASQAASGEPHGEADTHSPPDGSHDATLPASAVGAGSTAASSAGLLSGSSSWSGGGHGGGGGGGGPPPSSLFSSFSKLLDSGTQSVAALFHPHSTPNKGTTGFGHHIHPNSATSSPAASLPPSSLASLSSPSGTGNILATTASLVPRHDYISRSRLSIASSPSPAPLAYAHGLAAIGSPTSGISNTAASGSLSSSANFSWSSGNVAAVPSTIPAMTSSAAASTTSPTLLRDSSQIDSSTLKQAASLIPVIPPVSFVPPSPAPQTSPFKPILRASSITNDLTMTLSVARQSSVTASTSAGTDGSLAFVTPYRTGARAGAADVSATDPVPVLDFGHTTVTTVAMTDISSSAIVPSNVSPLDALNAAAGSVENNAVSLSQSSHSTEVILDSAVAGAAASSAISSSSVSGSSSDVHMTDAAPAAHDDASPQQIAPTPSLEASDLALARRLAAQQGQLPTTRRRAKQEVESLKQQPQTGGAAPGSPKRGRKKQKTQSVDSDAAVAATESSVAAVAAVMEAEFTEQQGLPTGLHPSDSEGDADQVPMDVQLGPAVVVPATAGSEGGPYLSPQRRGKRQRASSIGSAASASAASSLCYSAPAKSQQAQNASHRVRFDRAEIHEFNLIPDASKVPGGPGDYSIGMERVPHTSYVASVDVYDALRTKQRNKDGPSEIDEDIRRAIWQHAQEEAIRMARKRMGIRTLSRQQERVLQKAVRKRKREREEEEAEADEDDGEASGEESEEMDDEEAADAEEDGATAKMEDEDTSSADKGLKLPEVCLEAGGASTSESKAEVAQRAQLPAGDGSPDAEVEHAAYPDASQAKAEGPSSVTPIGTAASAPAANGGSAANVRTANSGTTATDDAAQQNASDPPSQPAAPPGSLQQPSEQQTLAHRAPSPSSACFRFVHMKMMEDEGSWSESDVSNHEHGEAMTDEQRQQQDRPRRVTRKDSSNNGGSGGLAPRLVRAISAPVYAPIQQFASTFLPNLASSLLPPLRSASASASAASSTNESHANPAAGASGASGAGSAAAAGGSPVLIFSDSADLSLIRQSRREAGCNCRGTKTQKVCGSLEDMRTAALIMEEKRKSKRGATKGLRKSFFPMIVTTSAATTNTGTSTQTSPDGQPILPAASVSSETEASADNGVAPLSPELSSVVASVLPCPCYVAGVGCNSNICSCFSYCCTNPHERYVFNQAKVNQIRRKILKQLSSGMYGTAAAHGKSKK